MRSKSGIGAVPLILILVVTLSAALFLYRVWHPAAERDAAGEGTVPAAVARAPETAPPFSLKDVNGNGYSSSRFAGKPTVINFFATWCPSCRDEIPGFVEVYNRHKDKGFEMIGISLDTDTREALPGFLAGNGVEYTVLLGDLATVRAYGGFSTVPTTFFVGRDGKIRNILVGHIGTETFDREVRKLF
jgi:peroxiredoxin